MERRCRPLLGTFVTISADVPAAVDAGFEAVAAVHAAMNFHDPASELSVANRIACRATVRLSGALATVIARALHWARRSDGAFDPTMTRDWRAVRLDGDALRFAAPLQLDLSGIAKGYAVDAAVDALRAAGAAAGLVDAGGDLRAFGELDWPMTLVDPGTRRPLAELRLRDAALATSAGRPGGDFAHLPGRARETVSATVRAASCIDADALAKIVLAASPHAGLCLASVGAQALTLDAAGALAAAA